MNQQLTGKIQLLPPSLINRIAAGEVVERPASVVKELVENALDAGATRIDIQVGAGGRDIRIADNGSGMSPENAALAFYNHATSKIRDAEDLHRLETLGFRGEALASIASISRLTCLTRTPDALLGTKVIIDEHGEPCLSNTGCAPGTIMEVNDLFYNTPARLKFLKRAQTEVGYLEEAVQYLAVSHPEVRFSLTLNDKVILKTGGAGVLRQTLNDIYKLHQDNTPLAPVALEDAEIGLRLSGFASEPGFMKSSKRWIVTYVNGRHVRCSVLQKAIEAAYDSLLPHGKYPFCIIFLNMPSGEVDVNVHPAKREVRYASASTIFSFVKSGIRRSLSERGIQWNVLPETPSQYHPENAAHSAFGHGPEQFMASQGVQFSETISQRGLRENSGSGLSTGKTGWQHASSEPLPEQSAIQFYQPASTDRTKTASVSQTDEQPPNRFNVVGQLFNTYILLETVQGLMVVDQHIASERTFFEALMLNFTSSAPAVQHFITSQPMRISPSQQDLLTNYQEAFARLGFLYQLHEDAGTVELTGYPLIYAGRDQVLQWGGTFEDLLAQLEETGEMSLNLDHMVATLSCHSAVRAGDVLSAAEMNLVIERWLACELPWTCPHGRPIAHTISKNELNHFFYRPSLPVSAL